MYVFIIQRNPLKIGKMSTFNKKRSNTLLYPKHITVQNYFTSYRKKSPMDNLGTMFCSSKRNTYTIK